MSDARQKSKRAYERGRTFAALLVAVPIACVTCAVWSLEGNAWSTAAVCTALLFAVVFLARHLGNNLGAAILPGVLLGLIPHAVILVLVDGHMAAPLFCAGCTPNCLAVCAGAGILWGVLVVVTQRASPRVILLSLLVAALVVGPPAWMLAGLMAVVPLTAGLASSLAFYSTSRTPIWSGVKRLF